MIEVFKKDEYRVPVKSWCLEIEENAMGQIDHLAQLPFVFHHVAIMADCHSGYGMPIGGVLATTGVVIPNAVGVDIGCGMCAVKSDIHVSELDVVDLKSIMQAIRDAIPVGFNHHKEAQIIPTFDTDTLQFSRCIVDEQWESAKKQLGTLGGGNHFIEIQADEEGIVWIMIHSGSRNLGYKVCEHYNKLAKWINEKWFSSVPKEYDLAFLPIETDEAKQYMAEMNYCVDFAYANRLHMMKNVMDIMSEINGSVSWGTIYNIAHNYAAWENHYKQNVVVHRKGATRARVEEYGIIPGSQGTASYIVEGLGNPESFQSCSHGAGRKMGRKDATRRLDLEEEIKKLDDQGIIHGIRNVSDLDEASGAYKDILSVMSSQVDLVKVVTKLRPLAVVKG